MLHISEIKQDHPEVFENNLRCKVYDALDSLGIPFRCVDTDEVITMEDCKGDKPFRSKDFSSALGISRVSFAPAEKMEEILHFAKHEAKIIEV